MVKIQDGIERYVHPFTAGESLDDTIYMSRDYIAACYKEGKILSA